MNETNQAHEAEFNPMSITCPEPVLLKYYIGMALLTGPVFPIAFLPLYFKYTTLKYKFDEDGVSMRWGILFRREVHLTYRRIQDIHLTRNLIQRWMGLATVAIQTASGSSGPEMSIEGIPQAEALRDFLYSKMRGARGLNDTSAVSDVATDESSADESLQLLREIRDALKRQTTAKADTSSEGTT
ncbi:MAG TPA: PH domain-containing protein [Pirellulaceae bacterium]|jgi:putative membrane protein|nr:PH domain-containing protein [Pirellulaceae bacterium]